MALNTLPNVLLGSKSPRRATLIEALGLSYRQISADIQETYPEHLQAAEIATFLAEQKAQALVADILPGEVLLCSDTVVWCEGRSLEKAQNAEEAKEMLQFLSNKEHQVITGVCLMDGNKKRLLSDTTRVKFRALSSQEIDHYIAVYQPFDKAGAYGIQEWIGMIGVEEIKGSYFTVMGLPCHLIFQELQNW